MNALLIAAAVTGWVFVAMILAGTDNGEPTKRAKNIGVASLTVALMASITLLARWFGA